MPIKVDLGRFDRSKKGGESGVFRSKPQPIGLEQVRIGLITGFSGLDEMENIRSTF